MQKHAKYTREQKEALVRALETNELDRKSAAQVFSMPYSTAWSIYNKALQNNGIVVESARGGDHHKKLTERLLEMLETWLDDDCSLTNEELSRLLYTATGVEVCAETIRKAVKEFHYTIKRVTLIPEAADTEALWEERKTFSRWFIDHELNASKLLYLDETGFKVKMRRTRGRSLKGKRALQKVPKLYTKNITVMACLGKTGLTHYEVLEGNGNKQSFLKFLSDLFEILTERGYILIMDNVRFHKCLEARQLAAEKGHTLKFLPPYSPFLNPIEYFFHQWKGLVRAFKPDNEADLLMAINSVKDRVTEHSCENYVRHISHNCVKLLENDRNVN